MLFAVTEAQKTRRFSVFIDLVIDTETADITPGDLSRQLISEDDAPITRTRVSRIASEPVAIGATLEPVELAELAPPIDSARFEGASIRKGPNGETLVYLVSGIADQVLIYMFEIIGSEANQ